MPDDQVTLKVAIDNLQETLSGLKSLAEGTKGVGGAAGEAEAASASLSESWSSLRKSLNSLLNPLALLEGAIGVGLVAAVRQVTSSFSDFTTTVRDLSVMSGASSRDVSVLVNGLTAFGVSADAVQISMNLMSRAVESGSPALNRLGVSVLDASGKQKDALTIWYESLTALSQMESATERNMLARQMFGRSWAEMLPVLAMGTDALKAAGAEINKVVSPEDIEKNRQYTIAVSQMKESWSALAMTIGRVVIPPFAALSKMMAEIVRGDWTKMIPAMEEGGAPTEEGGVTAQVKAQADAYDQLVQARTANVSALTAEGTAYLDKLQREGGEVEIKRRITAASTEQTKAQTALNAAQAAAVSAPSPANAAAVADAQVRVLQAQQTLARAQLDLQLKTATPETALIPGMLSAQQVSQQEAMQLSLAQANRTRTQAALTDERTYQDAIIATTQARLSADKAMEVGRLAALDAEEAILRSGYNQGLVSLEDYTTRTIALTNERRDSTINLLMQEVTATEQATATKVDLQRKADALLPLSGKARQANLDKIEEEGNAKVTALYAQAVKTYTDAEGKKVTVVQDTTRRRLLAEQEYAKLVLEAQAGTVDAYTYKQLQAEEQLDIELKKIARERGLSQDQINEQQALAIAAFYQKQMQERQKLEETLLGYDRVGLEASVRNLDQELAGYVSNYTNKKEVARLFYQTMQQYDGQDRETYLAGLDEELRKAGLNENQIIALHEMALVKRTELDAKADKVRETALDAEYTAYKAQLDRRLKDYQNFLNDKERQDAEFQLKLQQLAEQNAKFWLESDQQRQTSAVNTNLYIAERYGDLGSAFTSVLQLQALQWRGWTTELTDTFQGFLDDTHKSFTTTFEDFFTGKLKSFRDFWNSLWEDLKQTFLKRMADMVSNTVWNELINKVLGLVGIGTGGVGTAGGGAQVGAGATTAAVSSLLSPIQSLLGMALSPITSLLGSLFGTGGGAQGQQTLGGGSLGGVLGSLIGPVASLFGAGAAGGGGLTSAIESSGTSGGGTLGGLGNLAASAVGIGSILSSLGVFGSGGLSSLFGLGGSSSSVPSSFPTVPVQPVTAATPSANIARLLTDPAYLASLGTLPAGTVTPLGTASYALPNVSSLGITPADLPYFGINPAQMGQVLSGVNSAAAMSPLQVAVEAYSGLPSGIRNLGVGGQFYYSPPGTYFQPAGDPSHATLVQTAVANALGGNVIGALESGGVDKQPSASEVAYLSATGQLLSTAQSRQAQAGGGLLGGIGTAGGILSLLGGIISVFAPEVGVPLMVAGGLTSAGTSFAQGDYIGGVASLASAALAGVGGPSGLSGLLKGGTAGAGGLFSLFGSGTGPATSGLGVTSLLQGILGMFKGGGAVSAPYSSTTEVTPSSALETIQLQAGGPAVSGRPYVVGEAGPELFVPWESGMVYPSGRGPSGGRVTVNISVSGNAFTSEMDVYKVMEQAAQQMVQRLKLSFPLGL